MDESERQGRFSHSSGMRRSLELDRIEVDSSIQVGLRHFNYPSSLRFIKEAGPAQITALDVIENGWRSTVDRILERIEGVDHVFFSFDIDAIDPAHAPGAGAHEPGGLTSRDAIEIVKALAPHCAGFAVTEVNPMTDHNDLTSNLAAYLCYYFAVFGATPTAH
jgi:formiminoglutamase/agmatinase